MDADKKSGEKATWKMQKNDASYIEQIMEETHHQTTAYGHLFPITKTIQVRRRHTGYCWKSNDGLISDVLLWNLKYSPANAGQPARMYLQELCSDTGFYLEDRPQAMANRNG